METWQCLAFAIVFFLFHLTKMMLMMKKQKWGSYFIVYMKMIIAWLLQRILMVFVGLVLASVCGKEGQSLVRLTEYDS